MQLANVGSCQIVIDTMSFVYCFQAASHGLEVRFGGVGNRQFMLEGVEGGQWCRKGCSEWGSYTGQGILPT